VKRPNRSILLPSAQFSDPPHKNSQRLHASGILTDAQ
jgi:hypothetical protein